MMTLDALTISVKADCDEPETPDGIRGGRVSDGAIVNRAVAGEADAFRQLIEIHQGRITRLANRLTGYRNDVDDIVQDVFVIALEKIKSFRGESSFITWLTKLTISRCRREHLRRMLALKFLRRPVFSISEGANELAEQQERHAIVRRAIAALPQNLREVIVLRYLEEREVEEICQMLGLSRSALDVRLHRGREKLRERLTNE